MRSNVVIAGTIAATLAFFLDQASKGLAFEMVGLGEELVLSPILSVLPGFNEGTAFGLAKGVGPWLLILIALAISAWLSALLLRTRSLIAAAALGAAIGGATSNVADRSRFGAVRDFIDVHWKSAHWPTFNMADMFVVTGLLVFILDEHYRDRKKREAQAGNVKIDAS